FFLRLRRLPSPTLFPYTTLFRSHEAFHFCVRDARRLRRRKHGYRGPDLINADRLAFDKGIPGNLCGIPLIVERALRTPTVLLPLDRKSTRLNSSHVKNSYAVFCF